VPPVATANASSVATSTPPVTARVNGRQQISPDATADGGKAVSREQVLAAILRMCKALGLDIATQKKIVQKRNAQTWGELTLEQLIEVQSNLEKKFPNGIPF